MGQPGCLHQQLRYHQILDVSLFWAVSSGVRLKVRLKYDSPAIPPKQWVSIATCARFWLDNGFRSRADLVKKIGVGVSDLVDHWQAQTIIVDHKDDLYTPWEFSFSDQHSPKRPSTNRMTFALSRLGSHLGELHKTRDETGDFELRCQGKVIKAHSFILSMR